MLKEYADCRLKIKRAVEHIQELNVRMRQISADDSYIISVHVDPDGGDDSMKLDAMQVVPGPILCVIGDAIHNLRTALDFAMNRLVLRPTKFTKFPVRDTKNEFISAVNGGLKDNALQGVIDYLQDFVQPYAGGRGEAIWAIHTLDIEDKHGTLIAHNELKFVSGIRGVDESGSEFEVPTWLIVSEKVATEKLRGHRNVKITDKGSPSLRIVFGNGMPMEGFEVLPTLVEFARFVDQTITNIEIAYPIYPDGF